MCKLAAADLHEGLGHLVEAVGEEEGAVVDGDARLAGRQEAPGRAVGAQVGHERRRQFRRGDTGLAAALYALRSLHRHVTLEFCGAALLAAPETWVCRASTAEARKGSDVVEVHLSACGSEVLVQTLRLGSVLARRFISEERERFD